MTGCWVDGDHSAEGLTGDIKAWFRHVKPGGFISFHDYGSPNWPDVPVVVDRMMKGQELLPQFTVDTLRTYRKALRPRFARGLFAGIGGFAVAAASHGIKTEWHVEIDKNCQAVLHRHFPDADQFSDVKECGADNLKPVDIITFGRPCQDLSVAGKREGLKGERSGLFFEAVRIINELSPKWAVWENVPGALSSYKGADFQASYRRCLTPTFQPRSGR